MIKQCPKCGRTDLESTTMSHNNRVKCACGWRAIADLLGRDRSEFQEIAPVVRSCPKCACTVMGPGYRVCPTCGRKPDCTHPGVPLRESIHDGRLVQVGYCAECGVHILDDM